MFFPSLVETLGYAKQSLKPNCDACDLDDPAQLPAIDFAGVRHVCRFASERTGVLTLGLVAGGFAGCLHAVAFAGSAPRGCALEPLASLKTLS